MKIVIDVDGVLANTMPILNAFYNRRLGTNFKLSNYQYHDLEKTWGCSKEEAVRVVEAFYQSPEFLTIQPLSGAIEGVTSLARRNELFSVTSRPELVREATEDFIKRNFHAKIKMVIHTGHYTHLASDISKGKICKAEGAGILIEDCLETALDGVNHGITSFLLNQPWNQPNGNYVSIPQGFHRVFNWSEIVGRLT